MSAGRALWVMRRITLHEATVRGGAALVVTVTKPLTAAAPSGFTMEPGTFIVMGTRVSS